MPDIRLAQSSWELIDTLKRVWNFRVNYAPIRLAIGRSLLSGDVPNFELRGEDGLGFSGSPASIARRRCLDVGW